MTTNYIFHSWIKNNQDSGTIYSLFGQWWNGDNPTSGGVIIGGTAIGGTLVSGLADVFTIHNPITNEEPSNIFTGGEAQVTPSQSYNELFRLGSHTKDSNLVAWWPLQDNAATSTVTDQSGAGLSLTIQNSKNSEDLTSTGPNTWLISAFNFNGSSDYVNSVSDNSAFDFSTEMTLLFRVSFNIVTGGANGAPISKYNTSGNQRAYLCYQNNAELRFVASGNGIYNASQDDTFNTSLSAGVWTSVGISYDSVNGYFFYREGLADGTHNIFPSSIFNSNTPFTLGRTDTGSRYLNGSLTDVSCFNRVLNSIEHSEWNLGPEPVNSVAPVVSSLSDPCEGLRKQSITIQSSQISATLTDFPVLITRDHLDNEVVDPSGNSNAQLNGGDLKFYSDSALTNRLACEVAQFEYDSSTSAGDASIQIWVKVPSISSSVNTAIYMTYNEPDSQPAVGDTYGRNAVWSGARAVYHCETAPRNGGTIIDSTGNQDGTWSQGGGVFDPTQVTGKFGNGFASSATVTYDWASGLSVSLSSDDVTILGWTQNKNTNTWPINLFNSNADGWGILFNGSNIQLYDDSDAGDTALYSTSITADTWINVVIQNDSGGNAQRMWVNNVLAGDTEPAATLSASYGIGLGSRSNTAGFGLNWVDEVQIWNEVLSSAWINASYSNQNTPSVFATAGTPENVSCPQLGVHLISSTGTWGLPSPFASGSNGDIIYSYQWTRSNDSLGTNETDIPGATSGKYTSTDQDIGKHLRCRVRATNNGGFDSLADTSSQFILIYSGGLKASGEAQVSSSEAFIPSGGIKARGIARIYVNFPNLGGTIVGGSAEVSFKNNSYNRLFGLGSHNEDANLEGWFLLNENAANTTVTDQSSNGRNGILAGGDNTQDKNTTGPNDWVTLGFLFNGIDDYVNLNNSVLPSSRSPFSVLVRAQTPSSFSGNPDVRIISGSDFTGNARSYIGHNSSGNVFWRVGGQSDQTGTLLSISTWYDFALTYDGNIGGNVNMYVDGVAENTTTATYDGTANPSISSFDNGTNSHWDGRGADFVTFSKELTISEINQWINGPEPVNSVAPVVSGTESNGLILSVTTGTWGLSSPFSFGSNGTIEYSYQWTRSDTNTGLNETNISGATNSTYTLTDQDIGKYIRCLVRASNSGGFDSLADTNSNFTGIIKDFAAGCIVSGTATVTFINKSFNKIFGLGSHTKDSNLVAWWPLQDNAANTTVTDQSGAGLNLTVQNSKNSEDLTSTGPNSWLTSAFNFNGSDFVNSVSDNSAFDFSTKMTWLFRANFDSVTGGAGGLIISKRALFETSYVCYHDNNTLILLLTEDGFSGPEDAFDTSLTAGVWTSFGISYDSSTGHFFYREGLADGVHNVTASSIFNSSAPLELGLNLDGRLVDVSCFDRALSSAEHSEWNSGPEPTNSVAPVISGTENKEQILSVTTGTWGLSSPFSSGSNGTIEYSYQWTRSDDNTGLNEKDISGATNNTYALTIQDVDKYIRCRVRASNSGGFDSLADTNSNFTGQITGNEIGSGGILVSGIANLNVIYNPTTNNGVLVGGQLLSEEQVAGGILVGGVANFNVIYNPATNNGVLAGGLGQVLSVKNFIPDGGIIVGGEGIEEISLLGKGGILTSGTANLSIIYNPDISNGVLVSGLSEISSAETFLPAGGTITSGEAGIVQSRIIEEEGQGGTLTGGTGNISIFYNTNTNNGCTINGVAAISILNISYNRLFGLGAHSNNTNLSGWWTLQDNAANTTVADQTGSNNGVLNGGNNTSDLATTGPNSWLTSALSFNSPNYIDLNNASRNIGDGASEITVLFRFKTVSTAYMAPIGNYAGTNTGSSAMQITANRGAGFPTLTTDAIFIWSRRSQSGTDVEGYVTGTNLTNGEWHNESIVFNFVNNLLNITLDKSSFSITYTEQNYSSTKQTFERSIFIGAQNNEGTASDYFNGEITDVSFFNRELSKAEKDGWEDGPEPINSVAPVISGNEKEGQILSVTSGTWGLPSPFSSGSNGEITYSYQWTRSDNNTGLNEIDIPGATVNTYTLVRQDVNKYIRCRVRASNSGGFDALADTNSNFSGQIEITVGGVKLGGTSTISIVRNTEITGGLLVSNLVNFQFTYNPIVSNGILVSGGSDQIANEFGEGGALAGGNATAKITYNSTTLGGVIVSNLADIYISNQISVSNGAISSGTVEINLIYNTKVSGGSVVNGIAIVGEAENRIPEGGILIDGTANFNIIISTEISGGSVISGIAIVGEAENRIPEGGILAGGTAEINLIYNIEISGGSVVSGIAIVGEAENRIPEGGLLASGTAIVTVIYSTNTSNGAVIGGIGITSKITFISVFGGCLINGFVEFRAIFQPPMSSIGVLLGGRQGVIYNEEAKVGIIVSGINHPAETALVGAKLNGSSNVTFDSATGFKFKFTFNIGDRVRTESGLTQIITSRSINSSGENVYRTNLGNDFSESLLKKLSDINAEINLISLNGEKEPEGGNISILELSTTQKNLNKVNRIIKNLNNLSTVPDPKGSKIVIKQ